VSALFLEIFGNEDFLSWSNGVLIDLEMINDFRSILDVHGSVDDDQDLKNQEGKADKDESKDLTTSVGNSESSCDIFSALFGCSHISIDSDSHANVSRENGGETTDDEGNGCVVSAGLNLSSEGNEDGEENDESGQEKILLI
jgi:hypothetical protein